LLASPETLQALREENALLKKQIADFKPAAPDPAEAARLNSELAGLRKQIAALQAAAAVGFWKNRPWKMRAAIADRGGKSAPVPGAQPGGKKRGRRSGR